MTYLRPWCLCYDAGKIVGFMRPSYFKDSREHLYTEYKRLDVIILYYIDHIKDSNEKKWFVEKPSFMYPVSETNTPESLMFEVDLRLLECGRYKLEDPFIFPDNEL